jgi:hypothetical protein
MRGSSPAVLAAVIMLATGAVAVTLTEPTDGAPTRRLPDGSADRPWEQPNGPACFEEWIAVATRTLNTFDFGSEGNARKPWEINQYGLPVHRFLRSEYAPDNWADYGENRYWYMWGNYDHNDTRWGWDDWNRAGVPLLRPYVLECLRNGTGGASPESTGAGVPGTPAQGQGLVGTWTWSNGARVDFRADGTGTASNGFTATWRRLADGRLEIQWAKPGQPTRFTDVVSLSADGRTLSGRNQYGAGVSATSASRPASAGGRTLLGTWRWNGGATVECRADGTCTASNGFSGPWRSLDSSGRFEIRWGRPGQPDQFIDTFTIAPGGGQLSGKNQYGVAMSATRL